MKNKNVYQANCDYLYSAPKCQDLPNFLGLPFRKLLLLGPVVAASTTFSIDVGNLDSSKIKEEVDAYIQVDSTFDAKLRTYKKIENIFTSQLMDESFKKTMAELRTNIVAFSALQGNWDGFGAIPMSAKSATNAITLLDFLSPRAIKLIEDYFPESNGTISLQWGNVHERVSVNVGAERMSYYVKHDGLDTIYCNSIAINETEGKLLNKRIESVICM